ncbi:hypothetical protein [Aurantibacillus circumpalustris]|uniref:hypothetical protein n=1 Tax=Aurantibacillus circumpalustris TaxID=3036359 RepID=UPI00295AE547|nr:hypothetical protein [Aurantibacillus circumpalustris]
MLLKKYQSYLPFLFGLVVGISFFNLDLLSPHSAHLPGDIGDGRFNHYLLEHAYRFFIGKVDSFWSAPFLYPEENVITYSDNLLGSAPFYAIFRLSGFNPEVSLQCWFVITSALNYACCYFLFKYVFKNNYTAVIGAMVFAFSIALQSQMSHAQTFPRFAIPLTFLMGAMFLRELNPKYFFGLVFFLVYQMYCGLYLGFMLFVPTILFLLFTLVYKYQAYIARFKEIKWWAFMLIALVLNIVILLPLMIPYLQRTENVELYPYELVLKSVPTITSHFYSHYGSKFWEFLNEYGYHYESFWDHQIFAGGIATISFIASLIVLFGKTLRLNLFARITMTHTAATFFCTGLFTFLFFIRFENYSLYKVIHFLPGFASMRALQRIVNIELLFYSFAATYFLNLIFQNKNKYNALVFVLFVGFVYLDNHIGDDCTDRYTVAEAQQRKNNLLEKLKGIKEGSIISYEPDTIINNAVSYQLDAMMASQAAGLKTLNGYTATSPVGYSAYWINPNEVSRLGWLKEKKLSPDSVIVIH